MFSVLAEHSASRDGRRVRRRTLAAHPSGSRDRGYPSDRQGALPLEPDDGLAAEADRHVARPQALEGASQWIVSPILGERTSIAPGVWEGQKFFFVICSDVVV